MPPPDYRFAPLTRAELPLLRRWLGAPHVAAWWRDAEEELPLIEAELGEGGGTDFRIVWTDRPFAYVQDYPVDFAEAPHWTGLPPGARGMDTFIGEPGFLRQGHAPRYLRARALSLLAAGTAAVVADPNPDNPRAVRAWRRAGFTGERVAVAPRGERALLLVFDPAASPEPGESRLESAVRR